MRNPLSINFSVEDKIRKSFAKFYNIPLDENLNVVVAPHPQQDPPQLEIIPPPPPPQQDPPQLGLEIVPQQDEENQLEIANLEGEAMNDDENDVEPENQNISDLMDFENQPEVAMDVEEENDRFEGEDIEEEAYQSGDNDEVLENPPFEYAIISPNQTYCKSSIGVMDLEEGAVVAKVSIINAFAVTLISENGVQTHHIPQIVLKTARLGDYIANLESVAATIRRSVQARTKILVTDRGLENVNVALKFRNNDHIYCVLHRIGSMIFKFQHAARQGPFQLDPFSIGDIEIDLVQLKADNEIFPLQNNEWHPLATSLKRVFLRAIHSPNDAFATFMDVPVLAVDELFHDLNDFDLNLINANYDFDKYLALVSFLDFYRQLRRVAGLFFVDFDVDTRIEFQNFSNRIFEFNGSPSLNRSCADISTALNYIIFFAEDNPNLLFKPKILTVAFQYTLRSQCRRVSGSKLPTIQQALDELPRNHAYPAQIQGTSDFDNSVFEIIALPFPLNGQLLRLPPPYQLPNLIPPEIHARGLDLLRRHQADLQRHQLFIDRALMILDAVQATNYLIHLDNLEQGIRDCLLILGKF